MSPHVELVENFYNSFQSLDGKGMVRCYHPDIRFSDPVFPELHGKEASFMWKMLCSQAKDFELRFGNIHCEENRGSADWEAIYTFSTTGRRVHNTIKANFVFHESKIIVHQDSFNFWNWSRMALGPVGVLLGWSPLLRNTVRKQAAGNLKRYMDKHQAG